MASEFQLTRGTGDMRKAKIYVWPLRMAEAVCGHYPWLHIRHTRNIYFFYS